MTETTTPASPSLADAWTARGLAVDPQTLALAEALRATRAVPEDPHSIFALGHAAAGCVECLHALATAVQRVSATASAA